MERSESRFSRKTRRILSVVLIILEKILKFTIFRRSKMFSHLVSACAFDLMVSIPCVMVPGIDQDGFSTTSRTSPTEKGGSMCREGGGKGSPGVITSLMNPGPYRPLYLWGWLVGRLQTNRPLPRGGSLAARWSPASLGTVRSLGPVRQNKLF